MFYQGKEKTVYFVIIFLIIAGMCWSPVCFSGENDNSLIMDIPDLGPGGDRDFVEDARKQYDFIGNVDDVQKEGIVVDDSYFKKASKSKISGAATGSRVGLVINDDGEVVLCEPFNKKSR